MHSLADLIQLGIMPSLFKVDTAFPLDNYVTFLWAGLMLRTRKFYEPAV